MAWAVQGCLEWQRAGLGTPAAVRSATEEFRSDEDVLGAFLGEYCEIKPSATVASGALYVEYTGWCEAGGEQPRERLTQRALGLALRERGFADIRQGADSTRGWKGIGLRARDPAGRGIGPRARVPARQGKF